MSRHAAGRVLLAVSLLLGALAFLPVSGGPADADGWAFSKTVRVDREHVDEDGTTAVAGSTYDVTVKVSRTKDLRGRQEVRVAWSGARPTGGVVLDGTSVEAKDQEFPVVVLQCRGVDTSRTPPSGQERLSPETCWTQTSTERYLASSSQTPAWRVDADETDEHRAAIVGAPSPLPRECSGLSVPVTARWLPLRAADGTVYPGGPDPAVGCVASAPESNDVGDVGLPSNTVYGRTGTDGRGEVEFPLWTRSENATLGCSATVACSLVVVPVAGLSCDAWGHRLDAPQLQSSGAPLTEAQKRSADASCRKNGSYAPGEPRDATHGTDAAVRGSLWWSASNWKHRVSVPLSFAPTGESCSATGGDASLELGGSVLVNELTASWRPTFCTTRSLFPFAHVQQADFFALDQVDGGTLSAAFASEPKEGGFRRPVVPAPLTVSGFAIAFSIDDAQGRRQETLRLTPRLLAKLVTQSYPTTSWLRADRDDLAKNPLNLSVDPEFVALNPGLRSDTDLSSAATIQLLSERADLVRALASWIDADPEARVWIDGTPDPWGMQVNREYRGVRLASLDDFLRDRYEAPDWYKAANKCYGNSPSPYLNLVANPQPNLGAVTFNLQYASSAVLTACNFLTEDPLGSLPLRKEGREPVGKRFVIGLVSLASADRYNLRTADLQTSSSVPRGSVFTSPQGRTFVRASSASLAAATSALVPDERTRTWSVDQARLRRAGAAAYPGVMPVYLAAPVKGLTTTAAQQLADLLCYAVDPRRGLRTGTANGQLPPGYLGLSAANGLRAQRSYTLNAVSAVRNQSGSVPALDVAAPSYDAVCNPAVRPTDAGAGGSSGGAGTDGFAAGGGAPVAPDDAEAPRAAAAPTSAPVDVVLTAGQSSRVGALGAPLLLALALGAGLGGSLLRWPHHVRTALREARTLWPDAGGRHREP
ncbi:hypothetical protein [Aeromicrobium sp.]|uniref:hypothetical protein n=1 Tax=Aeromicrobium sp. TaxID=1871063 RepID=UPI0035193A27